MHFKYFKWIFHYRRTPALVILFQHINKDGSLSCKKERKIQCRVARYMKNVKIPYFGEPCENH